MERNQEAGYQPIACSLHDRLEALATLRSPVAIRYLAGSGSVVEVHDRIADLYTREGAEFLLTAGGTEIRLDRLESVEGEEFR